jgi:hypothetical protein
MYEVNKSNIHGVGLFATQTIKEGLLVDVCIIGETIHWFGSLLNHSKTANGTLTKLGNEWYFVANQQIKTGDELTVNYWDTPSFIAKPPDLGITD